MIVIVQQLLLLIAALLCIAGISADPMGTSTLAQFEEFYTLGIELQQSMRIVGNKKVDSRAVKRLAANRFEVLAKLMTSDIEKQGDLVEVAKQLEMDYEAELAETEQMDERLMFLTLCTNNLHESLKRYFVGNCIRSDVNMNFALVKRKLNEIFGLQQLLSQLKKPAMKEGSTHQHVSGAPPRNFATINKIPIPTADKENQAIEIVAREMAKGKVHLKAGKLTRGPANVQDPKEVKYGEVIKMIGRVFHFYFTKDQLKSAQILNEEEFDELLRQIFQQEQNVQAQLERAPGDRMLVKLDELMYLTARILRHIDELADDNTYSDEYHKRFRESFSEIWTRMRDTMTQLKILNPRQEISLEFALDMAMGKYPKTEKQKLAFDTLLGGKNNSSAELFRTVGKVLMLYFYKNSRGQIL